MTNYATTLSGGTVGYTCQPVAYLFQVFRKVTEMKLGKNARDLTGQRFGRLTAVKPVGRTKTGQIIWLFRCDCGRTKECTGTNATCGKTTSCGCYRLERVREGCGSHLMTETPEYKIWSGIVVRCNNPNTKNFKRYGGRGISVCDRWQRFENFLSDMGERPTPNHSIDRIDNDGDYTPENCRWVGRRTQARNRRSNRVLSMGGKSQCLAAWAEDYGMKAYTVHERLKRGWTLHKALTKPVRQGNYGKS